MANMDTDASKLDAWRAEQANKLAATDPRMVRELTEVDVLNEYRRLVREDVCPPAEPDPLLLEARRAVAANFADASTREVILKGNWDAGNMMAVALTALNRGTEIEREREAVMTELAALGQEFDATAGKLPFPSEEVPAEPDQDTADTRAVLAAFCGEEWAKHEDRDWHNAKAALIAIKDRVRREEREAVCKWLSEQPDRIDAMKGKQFANYIARGDHRYTRP